MTTLAIYGPPGPLFHGWLAVLAPSEGGRLEAALTPRWTDLALGQAVMVGVDMPIGLAESGPRACDSAARRLLPRDRKPSVFAPPRRPQGNVILANLPRVHNFHFSPR